jgi:hypothetical protein
MKEYLNKKIKDLTRERKDLDTAIADFERLEAQLPAKGKRSGTPPAAKSGNLVEMKRKSRPKN